MKNKKGFTLMEIIICIGLIVLIGTSSIIGFKIISNKKLITKLEQITEKASEAAQVYIETNDTATNQLYNNKNGVSLPLQLLVNVGLLSLEGTELTEEDIKDQYVVTFLGGTGSSENCEQITSTNSWSNNQPIYLCLNSNGSSNLATIDPTKYGNKTTVSNEPYYFTGISPNNLIEGKFADLLTCEYSSVKVPVTPSNLDIVLYGIDRDDAILIAVDFGYGNENIVIKRCFLNNNNDNELTFFPVNFDIIYPTLGMSYVEYLDCYNFKCESWLGQYVYNRSYDQKIYDYIVRLPNTCKITSGTGMVDNKFKITC